MSSRLSKGLVHVGKLSQDQPGFPRMGPAVKITAPASTAEFASGFVFGANDVVSGFVIKVLSIGATSGTISLGPMATGTSGFVASLPVGSTGIKGNLSAVSSSGGGAGTTWFVSANYTGFLLGGYAIGTTEGSTGLSASGAWCGRLYGCDASTEKRLGYVVDVSSSGLAAFSALVYPIYYTLNV